MNVNLENLKKILEDSPEVAAAYLFGSAAKNETVVNDLDILVLLYSKFDFMQIHLSLTNRLAKSLSLSPEQIDLLVFDLQLAAPEILYKAVSEGILLKNESPELLTNQIEALSKYFLENEFLIKEAKRLNKERLEEFCAG